MTSRMSGSALMLAAALVSGLALGTTARAETISVAVDRGGLDLATPAGLRALKVRARQAAIDQCGNRSVLDPAAGAAIRECRAAVVAGALRLASQQRLARR